MSVLHGKRASGVTVPTPRRLLAKPLRNGLDAMPVPLGGQWWLRRRQGRQCQSGARGQRACGAGLVMELTLSKGTALFSRDTGPRGRLAARGARGRGKAAQILSSRMCRQRGPARAPETKSPSVHSSLMGVTERERATSPIRSYCPMHLNAAQQIPAIMAREHACAGPMPTTLTPLKPDPFYRPSPRGNDVQGSRDPTASVLKFQ